MIKTIDVPHATASQASRMKQHLAYILKPSFRTLLFLLAAGMFLFSCDEKIDPSSVASITSLTLTVGDTDYAITFTGKEGKITLPYATQLPATATVKAVVLSAKAKGIKVGDNITIPVSGTVTLTVTAEDDKTKGVYTITVEKASASKEASITALTLTVGDSDYKIDFTDRAYTLILPAGSTLPTAVGVKEIALSAGATGVANDDELPVTDNAVTLTVTSEDGETTQKYTVNLLVAASVGASITSLTLTVADTDYKVTFEGTRGSVSLPSGTEIPTEVEVKEIILSDSATSNAGTVNALTVTDNAVMITVTAEDGTTKSEYTVTFSVAASKEASVTSLTLTVGDTDYEIMFEDRQDTITLPYSTELPVTATVKTVTLSAKATGIQVDDAVTIPASGPLTLTVTAEDGTTQETYTVTAQKAEPSAEASITSLTLTVGTANYDVTFENRQDTVTLPPGTVIPSTVSVASATLSAGATGVAAGTALTVTDNAVTLTVTAEDGTTTNIYTVSLAESMGMTSFTFEVTDNESMALDATDRQRIEGTINQEDNTITFDEQSAYVYRDKLKATFEVSEPGAAVQVGGADQVSGVTEQDFSSPVSYVVRFQDGTEITYTVTLDKSTLATIPDASFRAKLKELFPAAFTEDQLNITHSDVVNNSSLSVNSQTPKLTSVKGIEFFTALASLDCSSNLLESLDISANTVLKQLYCQDTKLGSLDLSKNTALTTLNCQDNKITSLDVSKNTSLTTLWCYNNALTFLDMTGVRSVAFSGALNIGTGTEENNPLLATLRVNTALQDLARIVTMKQNRGADLTVTTVNDAGTEVCTDYTPAQGGGTCN